MWLLITPADLIDHTDLLLRSISSYAGSKECFALARGWLRSCLEQHELCRSHERSLALPTRMVELIPTASGTETKVRLIDCRRLQEPFAALSYSWGGESAQMLEAGSERQFREELPPAALPPTIKDAVTATRELDIRYLWVDALCIFQDSPDDFAQETAKMGDIYRGAMITIAGSNAAKISDSLLQRREEPAWTCELPWQGGQDPAVSVYLRPSDEVNETSLKQSPLNSRGWCLQESLLAPRTLWLGSPVNVFECASGQFDETGRTVEATECYRSKALMSAIDSERHTAPSFRFLRGMGLPSALHIHYPSIVRNSLNGKMELQQAHKTFLTQGELRADNQRFTYYDHWRGIVQHYSGRRLTGREDMLPALSGLAAHFRSVLGDTYLAGIWKGDVTRGLSWTSVTPPGQYLQGSNFPKTSYIVPSWSWASTSNLKIVFLPWPNQADATLVTARKAKLVDYGLDIATADPHGKVKGGYIVLRGSFLPIADPNSIAQTSGQGSSLLETVAYAATDRENKRDEFRVRHEPHPKQDFGLLHLCTMTDSFGQLPIKTAALLLVETTGDGRSWRRGGLHNFRLAGSLDESEDHPRLRDFKAAKWVRRDIRLV